MNQSIYTIGEVAAKWDVSPRCIRYMCNQGKIEGAIKRAGVWFIPSDAAIPVKNNKANSTIYKFAGTKKSIFACAIRLFMEKGYENVTVRDVALAVGITQSSMYNHFKSKEHMLSVMYDYFGYYYQESRPAFTEIQDILAQGTPLEILLALRFHFDEECRVNMHRILNILMKRAPKDARAQEINQVLLMGDGVTFVELVLSRAIVMGRFTPMDTRAIAVYINCLRMFSLYRWAEGNKPNEMDTVGEQELQLYQQAAKWLSDYEGQGKGISPYGWLASAQ